MSLRRVVAATVLSFSLAGCGYNSIQRYDEQAESAKKQISVMLQRRADLIPNLVATVKGYAAHEADVLTKVTEARAGVKSAVESGDLKQMASANDQLTGALRGLMVSVEAYPQLKADQTFLRLQDELAGTENRIAVARTDYNGAVQKYNAYIRQFPQVVTAKVTRAKPREYFNATPGSEAVPTVDFGKKQ
ncbi:MAG TPA: LemA family protein [Gemmatimonadaceae bacterium]|nr:LemA family protein [Gemmatimonadaceae bacterium]